jgi:hypothetical protein
MPPDSNHNGTAPPQRLRRLKGPVTDHCSFCGKGREEYRNAVSGPGVLICDACVALCSRMLSEREEDS